MQMKRFAPNPFSMTSTEPNLWYTKENKLINFAVDLWLRLKISKVQMHFI
jgi:hypothetical protein